MATAEQGALRRIRRYAMVGAAIAAAGACDSGPVGPEEASLAIRLDLSALQTASIGGRQVTAVTPVEQAVLTVMSGSETRGPFSVALAPGQLEAAFRVKIPKGPTDFRAEVFSNNQTRIYAKDERIEILGDGAPVRIVVDPVDAILAVFPDAIDLNDQGQRQFMVKNAGVRDLMWGVESQTPSSLQECGGPPPAAPLPCLVFAPSASQLGPGATDAVLVGSRPTTATFGVRITSNVGHVDIGVVGSAAADASVTITGIRTIAGPPVNPSSVSGDVVVELDVQAGAFGLESIDLLIDGFPIACNQISGSIAPRLSGSAQSRIQMVECLLGTDDVSGACVGNQLNPRFFNGSHVLGARITLADATTRTAANTQDLFFTNANHVSVRHLPGSAIGDPANANGQGIIGTNGRQYWGGPADLDGNGFDDNNVRFAACPVAYDGTSVGSIHLAGQSTSGPVSVNLGSGSGNPAPDPSAPFIWSVAPTLNSSLSDDPFSGTGHVIGSFIGVFDVGGANVTSRFTRMPLDLFWMDFAAPAFGGFNPAPPANTSTGATSMTFNIGGVFNDTNVITAGQITVFESTNSTCGDSDDTLLTVASGRIDQNQISIVNGTSSITFNTSFTVTRPGTLIRTYCFNVAVKDVLSNGRTAVAASTVDWTVIP